MDNIELDQPYRWHMDVVSWDNSPQPGEIWRIKNERVKAFIPDSDKYVDYFMIVSAELNLITHYYPDSSPYKTHYVEIQTLHDEKMIEINFTLDKWNACFERVT